MAKKEYPCPICGELTLSEPEYSFDTCVVCGWIEDGYQQEFPDETGANGKWTFNDAKKAWADGKEIYKGFTNPNPKK